MKITSPRKLRRLALAAIASLVLSGCDDFSLTDTLLLDSDWGLAGTLTLTPAANQLQFGDTVDLTVTGGAGPYRFTVEANELYEGTKNESLGIVPLGAVSAGSFTAGNAIGRLRLTVKNEQGATGETYVTVLPPTPSFSLSSTPDNAHMSVVVSITPYGTSPAVDRLILEHIDASGTAVTVSNQIGMADTTVSQNPWLLIGRYTFRLYAVAGNFTSLAKELVLNP